ncbi:MAG: aminodeoxychorismate/anthranilate synthase component II [Thermoplasmata archaeon]
MKVLLIDHEDSFVYNISQALEARGAKVTCYRSTSPLVGALRVDPDAVVLSPGPGHPRDRRVTGLSRALLRRWQSERPFLGVCLGHQLIADFYGGKVVRAPSPVHGETSRVRHGGRGIFRDLRSPLVGARYHSLTVDPYHLPSNLEVTARDDDGLIMGLRHRTAAIESVQFHPESYLTRTGPHLLSNFLEEVRR